MVAAWGDESYAKDTDLATLLALKGRKRQMTSRGWKQHRKDSPKERPEETQLCQHFVLRQLRQISMCRLKPQNVG
jgi:hypothetical protein